MVRHCKWSQCFRRKEERLSHSCLLVCLRKFRASVWVTEDIDLIAPVASNHRFLRQNCHMKRIKFCEVTLLPGKLAQQQQWWKLENQERNKNSDRTLFGRFLCHHQITNAKLDWNHYDCCFFNFVGNTHTQAQFIRVSAWEIKKETH